MNRVAEKYIEVLHWAGIIAILFLVGWAGSLQERKLRACEATVTDMIRTEADAK